MVTVPPPVPTLTRTSAVKSQPATPVPNRPVRRVTSPESMERSRRKPSVLCRLPLPRSQLPILTSPSYNDDFLATLPSNPSFFGDKSIVVHLSNKTRIACANFHQLSPGNGTTPSPTTLSSASASSGTALPSGVPNGGHNATSATPTGGDSTGAPIPPTVSPTVSPTDVPAGGAAKVTTGGAALFALAALVMF